MTTVDFDPPAGVPVTLAPGLTRLLAPNPSPMTFRGTNTYLLGQDRLTIIDPGPAIPAHLDALQRAIGTRPVAQIIVTHSHLDHSPLAQPLSEATGAPILAFGNSQAGRSSIMQDLAASQNLGGGEGIDTDFAPDQTLGDGDTVQTEAGPLTVLHTPGHLGNHICLQWQETLFSGDHIMGWASSLVSPPDGDLTDFMASCRRLLTRDITQLYPGHGAPVQDAHQRINALIAHRNTREMQILQNLTHPMTPAEITAQVYHDTPPALLPAAERNVLAHLIDLTTRGLVTHTDPLHPTSKFAPNTRP